MGWIVSAQVLRLRQLLRGGLRLAMRFSFVALVLPVAWARANVELKLWFGNK